jgi:hypothetical protein
MGEGQVPIPLETRRMLHDPSVRLEEYYYFAKIQRAQEKQGLGPAEREKLYHPGSPSGSAVVVSGDEKNQSGDEKTAPTNETTIQGVHSGPIVTPAEWETASRAARNASWGAV